MSWWTFFRASPLSTVVSNQVVSSAFPSLGAARVTPWWSAHWLFRARAAPAQGTQLLSAPMTTKTIAQAFSTRREVDSPVENCCPLPNRSGRQPVLNAHGGASLEGGGGATDTSSGESDHLGIPGNKPGDKKRKFGPKTPYEVQPNWGRELRKREGGPPDKMKLPHAHHAVFKMGRGPMKKWLDDSKDILEYYNIDWYTGSENMGWAPNKNHSAAVAKVVRDKLLEAHLVHGTKQAVCLTLAMLKKHFRDDTITSLISKPVESP